MLPDLHRIHDWALLSSPRLGESSSVGIDLQPTIALLTDDDADDDADVDADDDTTTQMMDNDVDNDAARRR